MLANGGMDREGGSSDLARLSLQVAAEFDKALRGEAPKVDVVRAFDECLRQGRAVSTTDSAFLYNHRTIGALSRAWRRAYPSQIESVERFIGQIHDKVEEAERLLSTHQVDSTQARDDMKKFFLALHRELLTQRYPPRRVRRPPLNDELAYG